MQVPLLKISKEHGKSGNGCHIRILEKGVEMEVRNGRQVAGRMYFKKAGFQR